MFKKIEEGLKAYKEYLRLFWEHYWTRWTKGKGDLPSDKELIALNGDLAALRGMAEVLGISEEGRLAVMAESLKEVRFNNDIRLNPDKRKAFEIWKENFAWNAEINLSVKEKGKLLELLYKNGAAKFSSDGTTQTHTAIEKIVSEQILGYT
jgi:hypothetical protein